MEFIVAYDVATDTAEGRQRLRRVAQVCEAHGQRVQKSVFECQLDPAQFAQLRARLRREMSERDDSLRIYRLLEPRGQYLVALGRQVPYDLHDPLVL